MTNKGFTLIEVLIAMLVLAVGLLGLAGLQASSLSSNQSAYNRSQATQLAYDLADRVRANASAAALTRYIGAIPTAGTTTCLNTTGCTPTQMAANDLFEWNSAVSSTLPSGAGSIAVAAGVYTITINWTDDQNGNGPNFQTRFRL